MRRRIERAVDAAQCDGHERPRIELLVPVSFQRRQGKDHPFMPLLEGRRRETHCFSCLDGRAPRAREAMKGSSFHRLRRGEAGRRRGRRAAPRAAAPRARLLEAVAAPRARLLSLPDAAPCVASRARARASSPVVFHCPSSNERIIARRPSRGRRPPSSRGGGRRAPPRAGEEDGPLLARGRGAAPSSRGAPRRRGRVPSARGGERRGRLLPQGGARGAT